MAPVDPLSLGPVLDLIERWQQEELMGEEALAVVDALEALDIPALRALAEQHAAQLRDVSLILYGLADSDRFPWNPVEPLDAAADFLAAPRREPEAE